MDKLHRQTLAKRLWRYGLLLALLSTTGMGVAANQPCSGKTGGIARCDGELFVCNDGSISASKRNCAAQRGSGNGQPLRIRSADGDCACGSGALCTGPRGGQYCMTASGNKSYKRQ
jgi:hypothetical protein